MGKTYNIVEKVKGNSGHHLFTKTDIKNKLMELFGVPETKMEKNQLERRTMNAMNYIPVYIIKKEDHEEHHKKYPNLNGKKSPFWRKRLASNQLQDIPKSILPKP